MKMHILNLLSVSEEIDGVWLFFKMSFHSFISVFLQSLKEDLDAQKEWVTVQSTQILY